MAMVANRSFWLPHWIKRYSLKAVIAWRPIFVFGIVAAGFLTSAHCLAAAEPDEATKRAEAFAWFSGLGYPDVKEAKFVRVTTWPQWITLGEDPPRKDYRHGFLLSQEGDSFTVLLPDLSTETFTKPLQGSRARQRGNFEYKDLSEFAAAHLKAMREKAASNHDIWYRSGERLSQRAQLFVLAWSCWRQGQGESAIELYDQAARIPSRRRATPSQTFRQELAADLAHAEMWRAVLLFEDAAIPRERILVAFERIVKNYPESEHFARAKETATLLAKMIQEDKEHAEKRTAGKSFGELSQQEQIAELIFQLRDQNGHQMGQPAACYIFDTPHGNEDSPAHQLVNRGYDAVPQLIEALDDERFSRSVGYHRDFYFSHAVLRISDCAEQILTRITGRPFYRAAYDSANRGELAAAAKREASAWYEQLQAKGEKQLMVEEVAAGDLRSPYLATHLVKKYPEAALPALIAGAREAKHPSVRAQLVEKAGQLQGDAPLSFLLEELTNGPTRSVRLAAARAVYRRAQDKAVTAMIAEWNRPDVDEDDEGGSFRVEDLASFLAGCGKVEAIEALTRNIQDRPVDLRLNVVYTLRASFPRSASTHGDGEAQPPGQKALQEAMLRLLLTALDDTEKRIGMSGSWGDKSFADPRICDIAGYVLNRIDQVKYPFDLEGPLEQRDRARLKLKNALRSELGLPALRVP